MRFKARKMPPVPQKHIKTEVRMLECKKALLKSEQRRNREDY